MSQLPYYQALSLVITWKDGKPYRKNLITGKTTITGSINETGYRRITLKMDGKTKHIKAHRLLWFMEHDECWPLPPILDHIDRDKDNNRIGNIRSCTVAQNLRNQSARGLSKFKGVYWHKKDKRWRAAVKFDRKNIHLGGYATELEAAFARDKGIISLGLEEFDILNSTLMTKEELGL